MPEQTSTDPLATDPQVVVWRFWLTNLLGWTEDQVLALAERWRDDILDEESMHYHEEPEYWISPHFVPAEIGEKHSWRVVERVAWVIYPLLARYRRTYGLTTEHLAPLRAAIDQAIAHQLNELTAPRPEA